MAELRQKRMAVVNDFSGFGRCSLTVSLPVVSAAGIECCALPTAVFSNHTGYADYFFDDYTDKMEPFIEKWKKLGLAFDGIYTGFLGSKRQIDIVLRFIKAFKTADTKVIVDPVMGDHGRLYATYTDEMRREMKLLVRLADVVTPNLTEACFLTGTPYREAPWGREALARMARSLCEMGAKKVAITGISRGDELTNFLYEQNGEEGDSLCTVSGLKVGAQRAGTGDVFSSIIAADMVNGIGFRESVIRAGRFIARASRYSDGLGVPSQEGICFEPFLKEL